MLNGALQKGAALVAHIVLIIIKILENALDLIIDLFAYLLAELFFEQGVVLAAGFGRSIFFGRDQRIGKCDPAVVQSLYGIEPVLLYLRGYQLPLHFHEGRYGVDAVIIRAKKAFLAGKQIAPVAALHADHELV